MTRRRRGRPVHGWLVLDKPAGLTSAKAVSAVRRLVQAQKAGHAGTLDPLATGVLPIALGEATKTVPFVVDASKSYRFEVRWGEERDTDDGDGKVTASSPHRPSAQEIAGALKAFTGWIEQVPPAYSALKVAGRRAYDAARCGEALDLAPRRVRILDLALLGRNGPDHATFAVECGKGAYVRALARDLGRRLGTHAHVTSLRRTRVGGFRVEDAISLDKLAEVVHSAPPTECILRVETALVDIPALALTEPQAIRLRCGQAVQVFGAADGTVCAMAAGQPVALAEVAGGEVRPLRVFKL